MLCKAFTALGYATESAEKTTFYDLLRLSVLNTAEGSTFAAFWLNC
jgi:hypothetical protein